MSPYRDVLRADGDHRVAVIGDVGGHLDALREELSRLGAADDEAGTLPHDLVVIQVGDLVHRGPDSDAVVALVDGYLTEQPDQWIQLVGNHETQYLQHPAFDWAQRLGRRAARTVRRWWLEGDMQVAACVISGKEELLVTHAGLTVDFWRHDLGSPTNAPAAAQRLNALVREQPMVLFRPGQLLGAGEPEPRAGPLWAVAETELVAGWCVEPMPFGQVHGHTSLMDWDSGVLRAAPDVARRTTVDAAAKHETVSLEGGRIIGVDPGHGPQPRQPWRAWVVGGSWSAAPRGTIIST